MKFKIATAAVLLALASGTAAAQPGWYEVEPFGALPPSHIMAVLRAAGLQPVSRPVRRGDDYIVTAVDVDGDTKRVVVDAEFGDIVRITALRGSDIPSYRYRARPRQWQYDDEVVVIRPPASVPRMRDADDAAARRRARIHPPQSPPPRAKPSDAAKQGHEPARTAAINPVQPVRPPVPRSRPLVPPQTKAPATPAPAPEPAQAKASPAQEAPAKAASPSEKPNTKPAPEAGGAAAPRVILPGGPKPKSERVSDKNSASNSGEAPAASSPRPSAEDTARKPSSGDATKLPPVQPLN